MAIASPVKRKKAIYVGAPACFKLEEACQTINRAFGEDHGCYLVGSALERPDWRDIDVRFIMDDDAFLAEFTDSGGNDRGRWEFDAKWILLTTALSAWLTERTGLPVDVPRIEGAVERGHQLPGRAKTALQRLDEVGDGRGELRGRLEGRQVADPGQHLQARAGNARQQFLAQGFDAIDLIAVARDDQHRHVDRRHLARDVVPHRDVRPAEPGLRRAGQAVGDDLLAHLAGQRPGGQHVVDDPLDRFARRVGTGHDGALLVGQLHGRRRRRRDQDEPLQPRRPTRGEQLGRLAAHRMPDEHIAPQDQRLDHALRVVREILDAIAGLRRLRPAPATVVGRHGAIPPRQRVHDETPGARRAAVIVEEDEREIAEGIFLEYAEVHGNLYGTSRTSVQELLEQGRDVLLEIDWQGAEQIRRSKPDCVSVFILPPSRVELERRLRGRGSDAPEVIERRLFNSREEIAHAHEFDYIIVNDRFEDALGDLRSIVRAVRQRAPLAARRHESLIEELLAP